MALETVEGLSTQAVEAAQSVADNTRSIATATEELSASIDEISRAAEGSVGIAQGVEAQTTLMSEDAEAARRSILALGEVGQEITQITGVISAIAAQTNLLALNATIEAARAGEAGAGFAVVAEEVKILAGKTHEATGNITQRVDNVREGIAENVKRINALALQVVETGAQVGEVRSAMESVAASVTEQAAAVEEIAQSGSQASAGTEATSGIVNATLDAVRSTREKVS